MSDLRRHQGRYKASYDLASQARRLAQARVVADSNSKERGGDRAICLMELSLVEAGGGRYGQGEELGGQVVALCGRSGVGVVKAEFCLDHPHPVS